MKLKSLVTATALAVLSAAAMAQDATPIPVTLAQTGGGSFAGTFDRAATGIVVDTFSFTPAAFTGVVNVSLSSLSGPVNFFAAFLNGQGFGFEGDNTTTASFQSSVTSLMPLELMLFGYAGDAQTLTDAAGVYRAVFTLTAVPEPQTYALLLLGLAAVGAARLRKAGRAS